MKITGRVGMREMGALRVCASLVVLVASAGCSQGPETDAEDVDVKQLSIQRVDYKDGSENILLRVKTCDYTPSATNNCAYCVVDDGWARIGGGGEILGENSPGASLRQSYPAQSAYTSANWGGCTGEAGPNDDKSVWVARSAGPPHQLRAYVIGIRLKQTPTSAAFKPEVSMGVDRVAPSAAPPAEFSSNCTEAEVFSSLGLAGKNLWLVGGGAQLQPTGDGDYGDAYLTASYPLKAADNYTNIWRASARFQQTFTPAVSLKCYAIGIDYCPAGAGWCFHHPWIRSTSGSSTSGYRTLTDMSGTSVAWNSWIPTVPGGRAQYGTTGFGRYLTDLIPLNGTSRGFTVRSKSSNIGSAASGATNAATLALGVSHSNYSYNAIRFNTGGAALYRPSGAAPVNLQQSEPGPATAAHRFHLEPFGSGQFRLRHGNPDNGSECAYRQTGGTSVLVGPCGTSTEFLWSVDSSPKLRNASAGLCLDNNNQGAATSNLVLKPCVPGFWAPQSVFYDNYSWPPI